MVSLCSPTLLLQNSSLIESDFQSFYRYGVRGAFLRAVQNRQIVQF